MLRSTINRSTNVATCPAPNGRHTVESRRNARGHRGSMLVTQATSVQPKTSSAVTQEAIATMFQDDSVEQVGVTELEVQGKVPKWLEGDFYRTGPGLNGGMKHWFDGMGMLVNFRFTGDGRVLWQQRFLETNDYRMYRAAGNKPQLSAFKYRPGLFKAITDSLKYLVTKDQGVTDNAAVTFYQSSKDESEGLAQTEAINALYSVDRETLKTSQKVSSMFRGKGQNGELITAHPKKLSNGDHLNVVIPIPFGTFQVITYPLGDTEAQPKVLYNLKVSNDEGLQSWMHDLAVSDKHVAVVEQPLFFTLKGLIMGTEDYGTFTWKPEHGTVIRVLALDGSGLVQSFKLPPMFYYHWVNTYDAQHPDLGACMCLDAFFGEDPTSLNKFDLDTIRDPETNNSDLIFKRIWLPLEGDGEPVIEDMVSDHASYGCFGELPSISPPAYRNPDYRYLFSPTMVRPSPFGNQISKFDVVKKKVIAQWNTEGGSTLCEPQMVQRPGTTAEDDGVLIVPACDSAGRTMVAVLDAGNLKELARAYTPTTFPAGFHSAFMSPLATP